MDDQPNRGLYYTGMFALIFLLAFLLAVTVFKEKKISKSHPKREMAKKTDRNSSGKKVPASENSERPDKTMQPDTTHILEDEQPVEEIKTIKPESFEAMLRSRADSIQALLARGQRRTDVILRYYPHQPDGKIVYSLSDLGFYLHERPTDPDQIEKPTNSLFYGDNVPTEDIQMVAYELIKRGARISQIKMSRFHDDWKANSIEIGTEASAEKLPVLSIVDIQNFKKVDKE